MALLKKKTTNNRIEQNQNPVALYINKVPQNTHCLPMVFKLENFIRWAQYEC